MTKLTARALAAFTAMFLGSSALAAETTPAKGHRIDVNTATEEQIKETLGVSDADAHRIVEGRPYAKREDLKERNVLPADTFEKVKKLIESVC